MGSEYIGPDNHEKNSKFIKLSNQRTTVKCSWYHQLESRIKNIYFYHDNYIIKYDSHLTKHFAFIFILPKKLMLVQYRRNLLFFRYYIGSICYQICK